MSLSSLPWFIRKEIIELVIQDNPQYISVSKEWLKEVVGHHGILVFQSERSPETMKKPKSILTPFFKTVELQRNVNINWDILSSCKYINTAKITINTKTAKKLEGFRTNLLKLPHLVSLALSMSKDISFDITDIIERNQDSLKELILYIQTSSWLPIIDERIFPNINMLTIYSTPETFVVQDVVRRMPKLSILRLYYHIPKFNNIKLPNVNDLVMDHSSYGTLTKLDLEVFPNLKTLCIRNGTEFANEKPSETVEELTITGCTEYIYSVVCKLFPKLKKLDMSIDVNVSDYDLIIFFTYCKHLTTLKMLAWEGYKFPKILPTGPFLITSLSLTGCFLINNHLLQWLSSDFKLRELELDSCQVKKEDVLEVVPFNHLKTVQILSNVEFIEQFRTIFNYVNYPHLTMLDIAEDNRWCISGSRSYDNDSHASSEEYASSENNETSHSSHSASSEMHDLRELHISAE